MFTKNKTRMRKYRSFLMMFLMMFCVNVFMPATVTTVSAGDYWDDFKVSVSDDGPQVEGVATNQTEAFSKLLEKYRGFISGVAAIGAVTMVILFIKQFLKLGASAGNPTARSQALTGCLWTGLAAAGLGAAALITGIFYKAAQ